MAISQLEIATSACGLLAMTLSWPVISQEPSPLGEDSPAVRAPTPNARNQKPYIAPPMSCKPGIRQTDILCVLCGPLRTLRPVASKLSEIILFGEDNDL